MAEQQADSTSIPFRKYAVGERLWTSQDTERYQAGGYDTVELRPARGGKASLDFVRDLPNLRCVYVEGPVQDDTPVFDVPTLESLTLLTRSNKPLRLEGLRLLRRLDIHDRPGLEGVAELPRLRELFVGRWQGADLTFLGDKPELAFLRIEGRKHRARLDGIERSPNLDELMVLDVRVESIEPLRGLDNLREVHLTGVDGLEGGEPWDLTALAGKRRLAWFHATFQGSVRTLAPLRDLPSLTSVGIGVGTTILDGDLSVFVELPPHVSVGPIDPRDNYSHTAKEIEQIRNARRSSV